MLNGIGNYYVDLCFRLHFQGPQAPLFSKNLQSAFQHPDIADQKLNKEISEGRIAAPSLNPHLIS